MHVDFFLSKVEFLFAQLATTFNTFNETDDKLYIILSAKSNLKKPNRLFGLLHIQKTFLFHQKSTSTLATISTNGVKLNPQNSFVN